jgi:hypothetical protein
LIYESILGSIASELCYLYLGKLRSQLPKVVHFGRIIEPNTEELGKWVNVVGQSMLLVVRVELITG